MALFDRFRSKPQTKTAPALDVSMAFVMGQDGSITPLAQRGAVRSATASYSAYAAMLSQQGIGTPEVYAAAWVSSVWANRCVNIIANALNRLEWFVKVKDGDKKIDSHPLTVAIQRNKQKIIRKHAWSRLIWGETFITPLRNQYQYFSDLKWLNNLFIDVDTSSGIVPRVLYSPNTGRPLTFTPAVDLAFIYTDNPFDDLRGLSIFESVLTEIGIDNDVSRATRAFYANDTRIGLMLLPESDIPPVQAQEFMNYWKDNFQGAKNAGKPVLMPRMIKDVKEIQRAPIKDDVELRESMRREICAAFGVPLSVAGAWDDAHYQSAPEQRKSFYEETIVPDAEMLAMDWNTHILPFFDDSGNTALAFDATKILSLVEDAKQRADVANSQLVSGGLMLNEYRKGQKLPELPNGNVFYVPNNITVTRLEEVGKPPAPVPSALVPGVTVEKPAPTLPSQFSAQRPTPQLAANNPPSRAVIQPTVDNGAGGELAAWRKKAMNGGAKAALRFVCYALPKEIESGVRACLTVDMDKIGLKAVFDEADDLLKKNNLKASIPIDESTSATPEEYQTYWQEYDRLQAEIGDDWLMSYMNRALGSLEDRIAPNLNELDIQSALMLFRDELTREWVGTKDEPGAITRMVMAGMAAGNHSLAAGSSTNPDLAGKAFLGIDWGLLAQEALRFAANYVYTLITGIDLTTVKMVQQTMSEWVASGELLDALTLRLTTIFKDPIRAAAIAQTESTRVYAEGANLRWQQAGIHFSLWKHVNDDVVCKICRGLHNVVGDFVGGWKSRYDGKQYRFPAHVKCRCFPRPLIS